MGDATAERAVESLEIAMRSGTVVIWARPVDRPTVVAGHAEIEPDGVVRSKGGGRVEIACPEGSNLIIGTSSGRVECHGPLGRVAVTGRSGRISIEVAKEIEVRSSSGLVSIGGCDGPCRVAVRSSRVEIGSAGSIDVTLQSGRLGAAEVGDALVRGASGEVDIGLRGPSSVDISTQSGHVSVSLPPGVAPDLHLTSRSGRIEAVEPGTDGRMQIATSSGRIKVTRR